MPCVFPFVFPDCKLSNKPMFCYKNSTPVVYHHCAQNSDIRNWCSTRQHLNGSHVTGHYAYCPDNCVALNTTSLEINKAKDNLAGLEFDHLWEETFYYLYGDTQSGHCHTYNPQHASYGGIKGQLYAMLSKFLI